MDCPSEENLIKMKLSSLRTIAHLDFDLAKRELTVFHTGALQPIENAINELNLGEKLLATNETEEQAFTENKEQKKLLWYVLIINFAFFVIEATTGIISKSIGLVADSLDMLADSLVYGISLLAVGGSVTRKKNIAKIAGIFQIILAVLGFTEILRRYFYLEDMPDFSTMIIISMTALVANGICLYLLNNSKSKNEAHMKASMIFTSNDVIINLGVIVAGLLVYVLQSNIPDLIVGTIVFVLVIQGAVRILKLSK